MRSNRIDAEKIVELNKAYNFFPWVVQKMITPLPVVRGEGVYFWDAHGNKYLDFSLHLMNVNAGLGNKKIIETIQKQVAQMAYAWPSFATEPKGRLGQLLAEITPGDLGKVLFTCGGGEANENAIKFARMFTGRRKILSRYRSFHGTTAGALALTGDPYRQSHEALIPDVVHVHDPYCYRCPFGQEKETCGRECIGHMEQTIELEGPDRIAAIVLEGVTGSNGIILPPDDYWPAVRRMCDRYGILLVVDEVMSGFGRTGKWFGVNHYNVVPDIMTLGKGITSGYMPLGGVIVSNAIAEYFQDKPLPMGLTNNGHPVAVAAGVATIENYVEQGLIENAAAMGRILSDGLKQLKERHPSVGDVRSIGLFSVIELVNDRETRQPLSPLPGVPPSPEDPMIAPQLMTAMREKGMHCFAKWNYIFPIPPLCIDAEQIAQGLGILDDVLQITEQTEY